MTGLIETDRRSAVIQSNHYSIGYRYQSEYNGFGDLDAGQHDQILLYVYCERACSMPRCVEPCSGIQINQLHDEPIIRGSIRPPNEIGYQSSKGDRTQTHNSCQFEECESEVG